VTNYSDKNQSRSRKSKCFHLDCFCNTILWWVYFTFHNVVYIVSLPRSMLVIVLIWTLAFGLLLCLLMI